MCEISVFGLDVTATIAGTSFSGNRYRLEMLFDGLDDMSS